MEGADNNRGAVPTYEQAMDMAPGELLEQLTLEETPDHLVAVRLAEHACRRFRDEYYASRRWHASGDVGTLALLGQANALRALRGEQAGFSRYNVDLAMKEAYDDLDGNEPDILDARVRAVTLHLGIAAIRHVRLDRHERALKQRAFMARRSHRPDTEKVEAAHAKATEAITGQRFESNRIRTWAHEAQGYLKWRRAKEHQERQLDYWPPSKVRLSAAAAALEIAAGEPHQAIALARSIPQDVHDTWWEDITPDAYTQFTQHWQAATTDLIRLARRYYRPDILGAHDRRQERLSQMLGNPDMDIVPEYPSADAV